MTKPGYQISFSNADNVSAWGGLALWAQFLKALRFRSQLARWSLPHPQSNSGYDPCLLVEQFVTNVLCGANRFCHMNTLRTDKAIPQICDWSKMPEQKAFSRFFQRFTTSNQSAVLMTEVYSWCADQARVSDCVTLDVDSTAITRFGHQQGAEVGYNPRYHGRKSHHPLLAFLTEPNLIVNFWLRPGNSHTANNIEGFLEQTKSHLGARRIGLLRADSGFLSPKVIDWCEKQQADFIIAAKMTQVIQRTIGQVHDWCDVTDGIAISEASYKASSWDKSYRVIFIRQDKDIREQAIGKSLSLFEDDWDFEHYRYSALVTNMKYDAATIWRVYRLRANCENQIKALKDDFGLNSFVMKDYWATEVALTLAMLTANLASLFRRSCLHLRKNHRMQYILQHVLVVPSRYLSNKNEEPDRLILYVKGRKRKWLSELFDPNKIIVQSG